MARENSVLSSRFNTCPPYFKVVSKLARDFAAQCSMFTYSVVLSNCIDLSNACGLYAQCTQLIIFDKLSVLFVRCTDHNQQMGVFISKEWLTVETDCTRAVDYVTGLLSNGRNIELGQISMRTRILAIRYFIKCILDGFPQTFPNRSL